MNTGIVRIELRATFNPREINSFLNLIKELYESKDISDFAAEVIMDKLKESIKVEVNGK